MDRLAKIFNCIKKSAVVADIGCDHGILEGMLLRTGCADRVIATDISIKSLGKAVALCGGPEFQGRVDFREGDGLSVLAPGEAETIVIAGLGGLQIADILKKGEKVAQRASLVLCPHSHEGKLRKYLLENGFCITEECLALEEGRYYQIICAGYDGAPHSQDHKFFEIGSKLLESKDPLLEGFLKSELKRTNEIVERAGQSDKKNAREKVDKLTRYKKRLEEYLTCL